MAKTINSEELEKTIFSTEKVETENLDEAYEFISQEFPVRNSCDELKKLLKERGIDEIAFKNQLGSDKRAIVGKWLKGQVKISRESAIRILLELNTIITDKSKKISIADGEYFITHGCWEDGFYERDYKDIIYMFCLKNNFDFKKAEILIEKYKILDIDNAEVDNIENNKNGLNLTAFLENRFYYVKTEEDLKNFFIEYKGYFGNFNRTAYKEFKYYYDQVINTLDSNKKEDIEYLKFKGEEIAYIHNYATLEEICAAFPNKGKAPVLDLIQKIIAADDINEKRLGANERTDKSENNKKLSGIIGKKEKVPRKYLILFFLMNRGDSGNYQSSIIALNKLLDKCGMPRLDSRNPFDWIVMNAFYVSEKGDDGAIDRMNKMYKKIFNVDSQEVKDG